MTNELVGPFRGRTHRGIAGTTDTEWAGAGPAGPCWGGVLRLYRRRGAGGAWEPWGWTCERCNVVWRQVEAPAQNPLTAPDSPVLESPT